MIEKISHIGIAVKSMEEALSVFRDGIGLEVRIKAAPGEGSLTP